MLNLERITQDACDFEDESYFGAPNENAVESYAETHHCSFMEACRRLGINPAELECDDVIGIKSSASVNLKDRSRHLLDALDHYSKYSRDEGLKYVLSKQPERTGFDPIQIHRLIHSEEKHRREGYKEFSKAFGTVALIESGLFDASDIIEEVRESEIDFIADHIGTENENRRRKLRQNLAKCLDSHK